MRSFRSSLDIRSINQSVVSGSYRILEFRIEIFLIFDMPAQLNNIGLTFERSIISCLSLNCELNKFENN